MRSGAPPCAAIAPSAMKYDADDASPSTWIVAAASGSGCRAAMVKRCQPSRCTAMPKRASSFSVIST